MHGIERIFNLKLFRRPPALFVFASANVEYFLGRGSQPLSYIIPLFLDSTVPTHRFFEWGSAAAMKLL